MSSHPPQYQQLIMDHTIILIIMEAIMVLRLSLDSLDTDIVVAITTVTATIMGATATEVGMGAIDNLVRAVS